MTGTAPWFSLVISAVNSESSVLHRQEVPVPSGPHTEHKQTQGVQMYSTVGPRERQLDLQKSGSQLRGIFPSGDIWQCLKLF